MLGFPWELTHSGPELEGVATRSLCKRGLEIPEVRTLGRELGEKNQDLSWM